MRRIWANWVRLATYSFAAGGSVTESHFHWSQRERVKRSCTGVTAGGCVARACEVQTANGFPASSQPEHLSGTYAVTGSTLRIDWAGTGWETWQVSQPIAGKLGKLTFAGNYCYTGDSHVKPMLQIVDSDGGFHGWAGVEASLNQTVPDQGANADDIGVFEISEF